MPAAILASQAFQPALQRACTQHPEALFLTMAVQPCEAEAAACPASLAAVGAVPGPAPGSAADRVELLQGLSISKLPCTLLMRGGQLQARLDMPSGCSSSGSGSSTGAAAAVAEAAAAVGTRLHAALQAAQPSAADLPT